MQQSSKPSSITLHHVDSQLGSEGPEVPYSRWLLSTQVQQKSAKSWGQFPFTWGGAEMYGIEAINSYNKALRSARAWGQVSYTY